MSHLSNEFCILPPEYSFSTPATPLLRSLQWLFVAQRTKLVSLGLSSLLSYRSQINESFHSVSPEPSQVLLNLYSTVLPASNPCYLSTFPNPSALEKPDLNSITKKPSQRHNHQEFFL